MPSNAVADLSTAGGTDGTYHIDISNTDALELTVVIDSPNYVRVQAVSTEASGSAAVAEGDHSDTLAVTAGALTVGTKS